MALTDQELQQLATEIKHWGHALGFQQVGITNIDLDQAEGRLQQWLDAGFHGEMYFMEKHGTKRSRPAELIAETCRIISVRMDYLPEAANTAQHVLDNPTMGYLSRYALGRDYHKLLRQRLNRLAAKIVAQVGPFNYRAFVDSAPVLEKPLAEKAGLGWIGKHTNLIHPEAGSWFFLGELYTDLPLPIDSPATAHCGSCSACITICPTQAIVAPFQLDARLCISYQTIENRGSIPEPLRRPMGNRIYGCDDCQLVCPWNKFAQLTTELDFAPRHHLEAPQLIELFQWDEDDFLTFTAGSAIRRIGYEAWSRNVAVALGNAPTTPAIVLALQGRAHDPSALVREHVAWALAQHSTPSR